MDIENTQICRKCNQVKVLDEFARNRRYKSKHTNICKVCERERNRMAIERQRQRNQQLINKIKGHDTKETGGCVLKEMME